MDIGTTGEYSEINFKHGSGMLKSAEER